MTLNSPEEIEKDLQRGKNEYRSGNQKFYEDDEIFKAIKARNLHWFKLLEQLSDKGDVFIAVGVSHLYGETGLLKLLENGNFQINRIYSGQ
ncbi:MAG: TraB/GumN family protein [Bdellovibrionaceae bacterium]|nr:TraB/GumN family protein [Pseudobdellovibrionaceae bacterium]